MINMWQGCQKSPKDVHQSAHHCWLYQCHGPRVLHGSALLVRNKIMISSRYLLSTIIFSRIIENEILCGIEEGYNVVITGMNRGITVGIAVYRYCLVYYPYTYIGENLQKKLRKKIIGVIIGEGILKEYIGLKILNL